MSFNFATSKFSASGLSGIRLTAEELDHEVEIYPSYGSVVRTLKLGGRELLSGIDTNNITNNSIFRGCLLFPFCDRLPLGKYSFEGNSYELPMNLPQDNCAIHGFTYGSEFTIESEKTTNSSAEVVTKLSGSKIKRTGYPFDIDLTVTFTLSPNGFSIRYLARNNGKSSAPIAFGWHPYFRLSAKSTLKINSDKFVAVGQDLIPTGNMEDVTGSSFDFRSGRNISKFQELDIGLVAPKDGRSTLSSEEFELVITQDTEAFPFTQLYLPPDRRSLAIEPIGGVANCFNQPGLGAKTLKPGQESRGRIEVALTF